MTAETEPKLTWGKPRGQTFGLVLLLAAADAQLALIYQFLGIPLPAAHGHALTPRETRRPPAAALR